MRFLLLGPLELRDQGRPLEITRPKQRALLAALLVNANRVLSNDALIEALWEEHAPETAGKALQVHVSQLRKLLGTNRLETRAGGYRLVVEDGEYDVHEFESLLGSAKGAEPPQAAAALRRGLALWRGEPLADFSNHRFAQAEIARLTELRIQAVEETIEAELARGRSGEVVGELEGLIRTYPLRERFRYQLMLALYRADRQGEALDAYREARAVLKEGLGLEPSRALRDLERAILGQEPALDFVEPAVRRDLEPLKSVFVGRSAEVEALCADLDGAIAGRGRLVLLAGEPGIGKSRLADELIRHANALGAGVLVGRCWEAGGAPAYWPWVQSLRGFIRETDPTVLRRTLGPRAAEMTQLVPELRELLPGLPEPPSADSDGARLSLFDATAEFLRNTSRDRPLVLFLDDLHGADAPSLLLLRYLIHELASTRVLVLGAYRNVDPVPSAALRAMLAEATREPATRRIVLSGLAEEDVEEYVDSTGSGRVAPELAAAIYEETEGNPLFLVEIVRLLAIEERGRLGARTRADLVIPESLKDVIARRFTLLTPESNRLLELAAVLGREFSLDALSRLAGLSDDQLVQLLEDAVTERVLTDVPGASDQLRFTHILLRDALYEGLTTTRRVRLHRLAMQALEALYIDDPGPHLSELAHHAVAGSDFGRGLEFARRAADRALSMLAYEEAARLYQVALDATELFDTQSVADTCELLLALGDAHVLAGDGPASRDAVVRAAELAREIDDSELFARAALAYCGRDIWGPRVEWDSRVLPLLEEALVRCSEEDSRTRAMLLTRQACAMRGSVDRERPGALAQLAVEMANRIGDRATLLFALDGRLAAAYGPEDPAQRLRGASELARLAIDDDDPERIYGAYEHMFFAAWTLGDREAMVLATESNRRHVEKLGQRAFRSMVAACEAMLALTEGRLGEAERLIEDAFRLGERAQTWAAHTIHRMQQFTLRMQLGTLEGYQDVLAESISDYPDYWMLRCALAHTHAQLDHESECRSVFEDVAAESFGRLGRDGDWLVNLCLLSDVCTYLRDGQRAEQLVELLSPFAALNATASGELAMGSVARYVARLESDLGHYQAAEAHFETALEMNTHMGARPWLAHTQADFARMLLARGEGGDVERAALLLAEAESTFDQIGMAAAGARARATMERGGISEEGAGVRVQGRLTADVRVEDV